MIDDVVEQVNLKKITAVIKEATKKGELLNIQILSKKVGLSRVTVSKYVGYLNAQGKITVDRFGRNKVIRWNYGK